ncbi:MAG: type I DNA topoisomerase [Bacteroidetes bacterium]|jgi:DNA topoisomerase-1|nr:type I DNA topoisomerase [Bacteroidota bacterium]
MKRLVVVESPTKARTIRRFLSGNEYRIEASMGHVRDLPASASQIPEQYKNEDWSRLGVRTENGFEPIYVVPPEKQKVVRELRDALQEAEELYIATDEDREGESIGWHLLQVLKPDIPVRRMVFHEITREAIQHALDHTRGIDQHLVDAQETRRILDRLVGYTLSPLLWKKIAPKLSAGRVQSVSVRLLVQREKERITFVPASYWDLTAQLAQNGSGFEATMTHYQGTRLATGRDFDPDTGRLKDGLEAGKDVLLMQEEQARSLAERLPSAPWTVTNVKIRRKSRSPYPPFITSTLQQEASRKLGLSASRTMRTAQRLYENGYITYMRTDSTNLSSEAIGAARQAVQQRYGDKFLSKSPRQYSGQVRNAQEAHEAIRPAGTSMKTAKEHGLSGLEARLYDLIWKRTVATQMANARLRYVTAHIDAGEGDDVATFRASGKTIEFPGFFRAYVEGSDDPNAALEDREKPLPTLKEGDTPDCKHVEPVGHETQPPSRYTEASLIKVLEKEGIGRPSTYATIIDTIERRGYVQKQGRTLIPSFTAFATNNLLERQFEQLVDVGFTAQMERILDDIASGEQEATPYLRSFYKGEDGLEPAVEQALERVDAREVSTISFPQWGDFVIRVGRYGPYIEGTLDGETLTTSVPGDLAPGDVSEEQLEELLRAGNAPDRVLGIHPEADQPILLKDGPYGPYVQLGDDDQKGKPRRTSLPKAVTPSEVTFEMAKYLVELPKEIGEHPETGAPIKINIGKYGPYAQHGSIFASLKKSDDIFSIDYDRAMELIAEKERKKKPMRVIGQHPETGEPVEVWDGRYGPYIKHSGINASIPDDRAPEAITMDEAVQLLEEKAKKKGKRRRKKAKKS